MNNISVAQEYAKCLMNPKYYAEKYSKVFDKTFNNGAGGIVPFHLFPKQIELINHYKKNKLSIVLKPRQAGISTTTAFYCAMLIMFAPVESPERVLIIANKQETAHEFLSKIVSFIEDAPEWLLERDKKNGGVVFDKKNNGEIILPNGSGAKAKATSKDALRGYTPTLLVIDEAAFIENGAELWTAASPSLSTGGSAILISTPNGFDQLYYNIYNKAINNKNKFKVFELKWYEDPRFNKDLKFIKGPLEAFPTKLPDGSWDKSNFDDLIRDGYEPTSTWYEDMCKELNGDIQKINTELNGKFLGSGDNVIPEEDIINQEKTNVKLPKRTAGFDGNLYIWEDPIEGHQYMISSDVSRGDSADFSTIVIFDVDTGHQVMEWQGKVPPDILGEMVNEWGLKYQALAIIDVTGGMGQATVIKLMDLEYPNMYYSNASQSKIIKERMSKYKKNQELVPGFIIGTNRTLCIQALQYAIRENQIAIRSQRLIEELKTFVFINGRADHMKGYHDDIIMATAILLYVLQHSFHNLKRFKAQTIAMLNAWDAVSTTRPSAHGDEINPNVISEYSWLFK